MVMQQVYYKIKIKKNVKKQKDKWRLVVWHNGRNWMYIYIDMLWVIYNDYMLKFRFFYNLN